MRKQPRKIKWRVKRQTVEEAIRDDIQMHLNGFLHRNFKPDQMFYRFYADAAKEICRLKKCLKCKHKFRLESTKYHLFARTCKKCDYTHISR